MGKKSKGKGGTSSPAAGEESLPTHLLSAMPPPKLAYQQPETLLPNCIWVLPNFFSHQECIAWIHFMEQQQPLDYVHQRGTRFLAARECYRFSRQDPAMSQRIFERLRDGTKLLPALPSARELFSGEAGGGEQFTRPVTCNPNLRLYKYCVGHSFGKHIDESNVVPNHGVTRMTVLIYLSECEGGATRFEGEVAFAPTPGALLVHVHGENRCLEHEADPVDGGTKYVLRTDLVYSI